MMTDFAKQLRGHRLTTIEVLYYMPDHPSLLQTYIWQALDIAPHYPRMRRFLDYWRQNIEARLHSVRLASAETIRPSELRHARAEYLIN